MIIEDPAKLESFKVHSWQTDDITYLYFLWFEGNCVYIGQTKTLYARIERHLCDKLFDKVTYEKYFDKSTQEILKIERANISHYRPMFNDKRSSGLIKREKFCFLRKDNQGLFLITGYFSHTKKSPLAYYYYDGDIYHEHNFSGKKFRRYENDVLIDTMHLNGAFTIESDMEGPNLKHKIIFKKINGVDLPDLLLP